MIARQQGFDEVIGFGPGVTVADVTGYGEKTERLVLGKHFAGGVDN